MRTKDICDTSDFIHDNLASDDKSNVTGDDGRELMSIEKIMNKVFNSDISLSKDHSLSANTTVLSADKKKESHTHARLDYNAWLEYKRLIPDPAKRYNYKSFKKIVSLIFLEIIRQTISYRRSWYIKKIGFVNFRTSFVKKKVINKIEYKDTVQVSCYVNKNRNSSKYTSRWSFKLNLEIKKYIGKAHYKYKNKFTAPKTKLLTSKP